MSDSSTPAEESTAPRDLRQRIAEVDAMPMRTPFYADTSILFSRIDRLEAKSKLLGDYVVYLLQRIDYLEAQGK